MTAEVYRAAGALMAERGPLPGVADEGGWWPDFATNEEALERSPSRRSSAPASTPGEDVAISLDIAATEFGKAGATGWRSTTATLDSDAMIDLLLGWVARYPIVSIEDPLAEDDEAGLLAFTRPPGRAADHRRRLSRHQRGARPPRPGAALQRRADQAQPGRHR